MYLYLPLVAAMRGHAVWRGGASDGGRQPSVRGEGGGSLDPSALGPPFTHTHAHADASHGS